MLFLFPLYNRDPPFARKVFQPRSEENIPKVKLEVDNPRHDNRCEPSEALNRLAVLSCFFTTRNPERCWVDTMWHVDQPDITSCGFQSLPTWFTSPCFAKRVAREPIDSEAKSSRWTPLVQNQPNYGLQRQTGHKAEQCWQKKRDEKAAAGGSGKGKSDHEKKGKVATRRQKSESL
ncbi:hypothetical protein AK812_SmicGene25164 [Symbiodinium microadriaticum]|uniref:Uncharacterized protein n=1 Tax=Symbiodinium microadriaticum TaxID=2951 RepID=A0A1Q9DCT2_SYMMI|nr:hypothetical protein AK812_SmicGene25164 [Symbiodinium microadriaticum]